MFKNLTYAIALVAPLLASGSAFAQVACGDSTCPRGFSCETESAGCPAVECVGDGCKQCEPSTYSYCKALPCQTDSDCDVGMVCTGVQYQGCADAAEPACDGPNCPTKASSETCGSTAPTSECVPRWQLHCETAADCGEGFTCEEEESCSCSGSGGSSTPSEGTGGAMSSGSSEGSGNRAGTSDTTCSCEKTGANVCKVIQVACQTDSDCASGFSCEDNPNGACSRSSDGQTSCTPADPPKLCVPPYSDFSGGGLGVPTSSRGTNEAAHDDGGSAQASGGCSVVNAGAPGGVLPLLALVGAAFSFSRRRRR